VASKLWIALEVAGGGWEGGTCDAGHRWVKLR
jgi:hypothetical protein